MTTTLKKVADYIDTKVIANVIQEELKENNIPFTFANAKKVWLKCCTSLYSFIGEEVNCTYDLKEST